MKLEEAIEILEEVKELDDTLYAYSYDYMEALEVAISALKETQQYREIGTVEEVEQNFRDLKRQISHSEHLAEVLKSTKNLLGKREHLLSDYCKSGTVEECREAAEKQKAKEPKLKYKPRFLGKTTYTCPNCGNCCLEEFANERQRNNYCWDCGQKLDWDENLEGMKDVTSEM